MSGRLILVRAFDCFDDVRDFLQRLPESDRRKIGHAIREFQAGNLPATIAKPLHGFGVGIYELKHHASRVVLTLQVTDTVWAIYAYLKDSQEGSKMRRKHDVVIRQRLRDPRLALTR